MAKKDQLIMVVREEDLFGKSREYFFEGFRSHAMRDYKREILKSCLWKRRADVEENSEFKQPIPYTLIVNFSLKKVFAFQRATKDKYYGEKRLQGRWSWGVGGHIEETDLELVDSRNDDVIQAARRREIDEEVKFLDGRTERFLDFGYLYDGSDSVGRVHFGIVAIAETNAQHIAPKDSEIREGKLYSMPELEKILSSSDCIVEGWSKIVFEPLEKYLR